MPFVVVQANLGTENSWVEPIPSIWLASDQSTAQFPPNDKQLRQYCINQVAPGNNWIVYPIVVKSSIFQLYEDAKNKCQNYVENLTDTDTNLDVEYVPSRTRKRRPVDSFITSQEQPSTKKKPQHKNSHHSNNKESSSSDVDTDDEVNDSDYHPSPPSTSFIAPQPGKPTSATPTPTRSRSQLLADLIVSDESNTAATNSASFVMPSPIQKPISSFQKKVLQKLNFLDQKMTEVLIAVSNGNNVHHQQQEAFQVPVQLPISSVTELQELNSFLRTEENRRRLLSRLPSYRNTELGTRVPMAMGKLFTNQLGSQLNWKGSGKEGNAGAKKIGLSTFPFVTTFVQQYIGGPSDMAMQKIKKWLANRPAKIKSTAND